MKIKLKKEHIDIVIDKLKMLDEEITGISLENVVAKLTIRGIATAQGYAAGMPRSTTEDNRIKGGVLDNRKTGYIALQGPGAVYDEFGTGDEGANDPHPRKSDFLLNPYNSGPTIRLDPLDRHYWVYKPMAGEPYFDDDGKTHGIPSGKMMYNTSKHLRSIKDEIIRDEFEGVVKKFETKDK